MEGYSQKVAFLLDDAAYKKLAKVPRERPLRERWLPS
jgi:hypothetical protein